MSKYLQAAFDAVAKDDMKKAAAAKRLQEREQASNAFFEEIKLILEEDAKKLGLILEYPPPTPGNLRQIVVVGDSQKVPLGVGYFRVKADKNDDFESKVTVGVSIRGVIYRDLDEAFAALYRYFEPEIRASMNDSVPNAAAPHVTDPVLMNFDLLALTTKPRR